MPNNYSAREKKWAQIQSGGIAPIKKPTILPIIPLLHYPTISTTTFLYHIY